ncbi:MAG: hypothetical protein JW939_03750 [Candidatus Thermoplasmatota archaeon]|nr:hypothetical protein [Candidatus Thermoplasmatota archaeon]
MAQASMKGIDEAMAKFLLQPSSGNVLPMIRETRRFMILNRDHHELEEMAGVHLRNCTELHGAVLTLESDPEIVKRNILARSISAIFPVMNTFEEIHSLSEKRPLEVLMNGLSILSEITQATQYLEATKLTSWANSERALVKVEDGLIELALETPGEPGSELEAVEGFMDAVRAFELEPKDRPFIPFLLWTFISVISYKKLKDML